MNLTIRIPYNRLETLDLEGCCDCTGGVRNAALGPADCLAEIIDTNRDGIVAARQDAKGGEFAEPPHGSPALKVSAETAKVLAIWISLGNLGDNRCLTEQVGPVRCAVWSTQSTEILQWAAPIPEKGVLRTTRSKV